MIKEEDIKVAALFPEKGALDNREETRADLSISSFYFIDPIFVSDDYRKVIERKLKDNILYEIYGEIKKELDEQEYHLLLSTNPSSNYLLLGEIKNSFRKLKNLLPI